MELELELERLELLQYKMGLGQAGLTGPSPHDYGLLVGTC